MKQYLELLNKILTEGVEKKSGRDNMPNTIGISKSDISINLSDGFPLLTTKKMFWKGIVHELLWFLRGETNIKYLVDNGVNIWNDDAYRWYLKTMRENDYDIYYETIEMFISAICDFNYATEKSYKLNNDSMYTIGDLGKVYGHQWRNQNGVDQVSDVFNGLKNNEFSRYHIIDGWNVSDFPEMALPPCHLLYQFIVRPLTLKERENIYLDEVVKTYAFTKSSHEFYDKYQVPKYYLDLNMYQRSVDTALGCPFNIASMSLLLLLVAKANNMIGGVANWIGGDTHLYVSHIEKAKEQLKRIPYKLPELLIKKDIKCLDDVLKLTIDDFELVNYKSHPSIKFELFVGLVKK